LIIEKDKLILSVHNPLAAVLLRYYAKISGADVTKEMIALNNLKMFKTSKCCKACVYWREPYTPTEKDQMTEGETLRRWCSINETSTGENDTCEKWSYHL